MGIEWLILIPWAIITVWWHISLIYYLKHREPKTETSNFGIKILTRGDCPKTIANAVNYCKKTPLVVSRKPLEIENCVILPSNFQSKAKYKGEQLEWARRNYLFDYTLYLDEDSLCDFTAIPDADMVQFQEVPYSDNPIIAAIEAHRIGFQIEQAIFERTTPLYLWGGGFAVKKWLEDKITWDRMSITEDTGFVFSINEPYKFVYSKKKIKNQAPLRIFDLIRQRRRWTSGTYGDAKNLKNKLKKVFVYFRTINWGIWPISTLTISVLFWDQYPWIASLPLLQAFIWSGVGAKQMGLSGWQCLFAVLFAPIAAYLHSFGATLALFKPYKDFLTTPKK